MKEETEFSAYLIRIHVGAKRYFCLWGSDHEDEKKDKFLILEGKILLFADESLLKSYVLNTTQPIFDKTNTRNWIQSEGEIEVMYSFELEKILSYLSDFISMAFEQKVLNELVDVLNLIGDFAFQIDDEELIGMYRGKLVQGYLDHFYDNHFWTVNEEDRVVFDGRDELKIQFLEMKELLSKRFLLVTSENFHLLNR